jgi:hypothetical protein
MCPLFNVPPEQLKDNLDRSALKRS